MKFYIIVSLFGLLSAGFSLWLAVYVFNRRSAASGSCFFSLIMLTVAMSNLVYTAELLSPSFEVALLLMKIGYLINCAIPIFWVWFVEAFTDLPHPVTRPTTILIAAVPLTIAALVLTNEHHLLMYRSIAAIPGQPLTFLVFDRGPLFLPSVFYLYFMIFAGALRILSRIGRATGAFRGQVAMIAVWVLIPWISHVAYLSGKIPYNIDITPLVMTLSGGFITLAIFRFRLFDLIPIARDYVVDAVRDAVVVIDACDRIVDSNLAAKLLFPGLCAGSLQTRATDFFQRFDFELPPGTSPVIASMEIGGRLRHFKVDPTEIRNAQGLRIGRAVIFVDTTETQELLSRLEAMATTDDLTGINNRRHFKVLAERELELARRASRPIALAMFDVDHFKTVNDADGHGAGDAALEAVCRTCRRILRSTDILGRYGGEEFVILFPEVTPAEAVEIAERLRLEIARTDIVFGERRFRVTASFGVTGSAAPPLTGLDAYLQVVDAAMYRAKHAGRNRVECLPTFL